MAEKPFLLYDVTESATRKCGLRITKNASTFLWQRSEWQWRIFIDLSESNLKAILLRNRRGGLQYLWCTQRAYRVFWLQSEEQDWQACWLGVHSCFVWIAGEGYLLSIAVSSACRVDNTVDTLYFFLGEYGCSVEFYEGFGQSSNYDHKYAKLFFSRRTQGRC
jgi:hypothetical protein